MLLDYLLKHSGVARLLREDGPLTLEALLMPYCETHERFLHIVALLEKLQRFENEKLKLSNSVLDKMLPYDSLVGMIKKDLNTLVELTDYLDLPEKLCKKLKYVIKNRRDYRKYNVFYYQRFNIENTSHWSYLGDIRGLTWAHESKGYPWDKDTLSLAAKTNNLECLKYAYEHGCPLDVVPYREASINGHLDCLKYLFELPGTSKIRENVHICTLAAQNGHLECLKYIHSQGCSWDTSTSESAAESGHLDCLKYLHEQGCPFHKHCKLNTYEMNEMTDLAVSACINYANEHGYRWELSLFENAGGRL